MENKLTSIKGALKEGVAEIRERRHGAIRAYGGTVGQLLEDAKACNLPTFDRSCANGWVCSMQQAVIRVINITDSTLILHSPIGCLNDLLPYLPGHI